MRRTLACLLAAPLAACGADGERGREGEHPLGALTGLEVSVAASGSLAFAGGRSLTVERLELLVVDVRVDGGGCADGGCALDGPRLVEVPASGTARLAILPAGDDPVTAVEVELAAVAHEGVPEGASVHVVGTLDGAPVDAWLAVDAVVSAPLAAPADAAPGANVTLELDVGALFAAGGRLVDPRRRAAAPAVEASLPLAARACEADDRDGRDDVEEAAAADDAPIVPAGDGDEVREDVGGRRGPDDGREGDGTDGGGDAGGTTGEGVGEAGSSAGGGGIF